MILAPVGKMEIRLILKASAVWWVIWVWLMFVSSICIDFHVGQRVFYAFIILFKHWWKDYSVSRRKTCMTYFILARGSERVKPTCTVIWHAVIFEQLLLIYLSAILQVASKHETMKALHVHNVLRWRWRSLPCLRVEIDSKLNHLQMFIIQGPVVNVSPQNKVPYTVNSRPECVWYKFYSHVYFLKFKFQKKVVKLDDMSPVMIDDLYIHVSRTSSNLLWYDCISGKKYTGARGEIAPKMPKRAPKSHKRAPQNLHRVQCKTN